MANQKNDLIGMDDVYVEIHRCGDVIAVIPSRLVMKDLINNHRLANDKLNELKEFIAKDENILNETKKRLIADMFDVQELIKFWNEYGGK